MNMYQAAVEEATEALRLDRITHMKTGSCVPRGSRTSRGPAPDMARKRSQDADPGCSPGAGLEEPLRNGTD